MAYKIAGVFSYEYIDADNSTPYETIMYCDVTILNSQGKGLMQGDRFHRVYYDVQKGQWRFYKTYEDGEEPLIANLLMVVE